MQSILLALITGLTTGGLSCLAVQGGLLASSLANQIEKDMQNTVISSKSGKGQTTSAGKHPGMALPILLFLAAKILAYTLLGFLLGAVGSMFQLTPVARAIFQFAIGIFMLGSALRMLNVHPIFRFFVFEPPAFLRRKIRKTAAAGVSYTTPLFLGFLTVFIPCGITQAMMAAALSTGNPGMGAALMAAFTVGTSPVFFIVAYFATRLGAKLEKYFLRFTAIVVLVLGLLAIDTGLNLAGSPISITRAVNAISAPADTRTGTSGNVSYTLPDPAGVQTQANTAPVEETNVVTINVKNNGYAPSQVKVPAGTDFQLKLVSKGVRSCALAFVIPSLNISVNLKTDDTVYIDIPAQKTGTRIPFSCSMGMFTGDLIFE